ncbi:hypothetical protein HMN09_00159800 [Mycena chlorophos]|uniref:Uncharacterized protein n=1 Tax=Mycena chlorophos TaxID=658473 RepID=A0A8H6TS48_MYCCL|nr:hypothetical protein HMN09_00159000 [Mycena chlorophos]KAF7320740.1 hypothetical protein HMN09_00159800 [Mycena chlorophos]
MSRADSPKQEAPTLTATSSPLPPNNGDDELPELLDSPGGALSADGPDGAGNSTLSTLSFDGYFTGQDTGLLTAHASQVGCREAVILSESREPERGISVIARQDINQTPNSPDLERERQRPSDDVA